MYKVAVIIQQIYARYVKGFTKDARFAELNKVILQMANGAVEAAATGRF
jgi:hypothetical protein